jgi:hypothetical protein
MFLSTPYSAINWGVISSVTAPIVRSGQLPPQLNQVSDFAGGRGDADRLFHLVGAVLGPFDFGLG